MYRRLLGGNQEGAYHLETREGAAVVHNDITDIPGIEVGHHTDRTSGTGCTVVMCRRGAVGGVDVRGGAPGTRETDLLHPGNLVERVHAVLLSGGSTFGLDAAGGVVRFLEEQDVGFEMGSIRIPIVPAAILYDLNLVTSRVRPGAEEGYHACLLSTTGPVEEGSVGAGTGATVAKGLGIARAVKGGIGSAAIPLPDGNVVGAIVAVNSYGGVVDHHSGKLLAGPRTQDGSSFHDPIELAINRPEKEAGGPTPTNTTIGVVATDASLTKEQSHFLARISHDGLALTIRPCHTMQDGDTMFALATGTGTPSSQRQDLIGLGVAAVEAVARAVLEAVEQAEGLGGVPSVRDLSHG